MYEVPPSVLPPSMIPGPQVPSPLLPLEFSSKFPFFAETEKPIIPLWGIAIFCIVCIIVLVAVSHFTFLKTSSFASMPSIHNPFKALLKK